jgi:hypothetical protein
MIGSDDPNEIVGGLGIGGLILAGLWRLVVRMQKIPTTPDP